MDGLVEIRLFLPQKSNNNSILVSVNITETGEAVIELGVYNLETNEIAVMAKHFSERFGGYLDYLQWTEN